MHGNCLSLLHPVLVQKYTYPREIYYLEFATSSISPTDNYNTSSRSDLRVPFFTAFPKDLISRTSGLYTLLMTQAAHRVLASLARLFPCEAGIAAPSPKSCMILIWTASGSWNKVVLKSLSVLRRTPNSTKRPADKAPRGPQVQPQLRRRPPCTYTHQHMICKKKEDSV
jgi:hypothetical protein